ncbi:hypothetical protein HKX48_004190 [Thoreauomyces humboldtii]|nr:hypothetical protein HKX48_004190 [Thoreauomyces humboldtii]
MVTPAGTPVPAAAVDMLSTAHDHILDPILDRLDPASLGALSQTCRRFRSELAAIVASALRLDHDHDHRKTIKPIKDHVEQEGLSVIRIVDELRGLMLDCKARDITSVPVRMPTHSLVSAGPPTAQAALLRRNIQTLVPGEHVLSIPLHAGDGPALTTRIRCLSKCEFPIGDDNRALYVLITMTFPAQLAAALELPAQSTTATLCNLAQHTAHRDSLTVACGVLSRLAAHLNKVGFAGATAGWTPEVLLAAFGSLLSDRDLTKGLPAAVARIIPEWDKDKTVELHAPFEPNWTSLEDSLRDPNEDESTPLPPASTLAAALRPLVDLTPGKAFWMCRALRGRYAAILTSAIPCLAGALECHDIQRHELDALAPALARVELLDSGIWDDFEVFGTVETEFWGSCLLKGDDETLRIHLEYSEQEYCGEISRELWFTVVGPGDPPTFRNDRPSLLDHATYASVALALGVPKGTRAGAVILALFVACLGANECAARAWRLLVADDDGGDSEIMEEVYSSETDEIIMRPIPRSVSWKLLTRANVLEMAAAYGKG